MFARDHVDASDTDERELRRHCVHEPDGVRNQGLGLRQDVAAVTKSRRSEGVVAHELASDTKRDTTTASGNEDDGPWRSSDELLQVVAARDRFTWLPEPYAVATSRYTRLEHPLLHITRQ